MSGHPSTTGTLLVLTREAGHVAGPRGVSGRAQHATDGGTVAAEQNGARNTRKKAAALVRNADHTQNQHDVEREPELDASASNRSN
jgi:hypothetical protein